MTLLEMTQSILSSLDSDEVNSIGDTTESMQVANLVKAKYFDILSRYDIQELEKLFQLLPSLDATRPTLMYLPDDIEDIKWVKYFDSSTLDSQNESQFGAYSHDLNTDIVVSSSTALSASTAGYKYVTLLPTDQFIDMINRFNPNDTNVGTYTLNEGTYEFTFYYKNNIQPSYCTVLSNNYVIFDTYDSSFDTTLQASKSMCVGQKTPQFLMEDTFVPVLDPQRFPLLLNEVKSLAYYELKQMPHAKADQEIKRQWSAIQKEQSKANKPNYFEQLADFGRVPRTGGYSGGGYGAYKWMRQTSP